MREDQISRHWQILLILEARRNGVTAEELGELIGCSKRTVYRDLNALEDAGFPLTTEERPDGVHYQFVEGYKNRIKLSFSPIELIALNLATVTSAFLEGTIFHKALNTARDKVRATLDENHREYADVFGTNFQASFRPIRHYSNFQDTIEGVLGSLKDKRTLKISYWAAKTGKEGKREIEPYRLWYASGNLYLIAYCRLRKSVRTFLIDRIRQWELTENEYKIPTDFDFEDFSKGAFKVLGGEKEQLVVVRVNPLLKPMITEQTWHPTQKVEELKDGWLRVSFKLGALNEVKTWIQGYAPYIIVEKPKELAEEILKSFEEYKKEYGKAR